MPNMKNSNLKILVVAIGTLAASSFFCISPASAQVASFFALMGERIVLLAGNVAKGVFNARANDGQRLEAFTQEFVKAALQNHPDYNVVVSHNGGQVWGAGAIHQHVEIPMTVGTCGYEVYFFPRGRQFVFKRNGDGGYINWALGGYFNQNGDTVTFY